MLLLLTLLACREHPDGPPPPPDQPPSVDTADPAPTAGSVAAETPVVGDLTVRSIKIHPDKPTATTDLQARVETTRPPGRMVTVRYQWLVNESPLDGETGDVLVHGKLRRNDKVQLQVRASDGEREVEMRSEVLHVANSPPVIQVPRGGLSGAIDGAQVSASDPDNDTLRFSIKNGPPGLSIDSQGVLHFSGAKATEGAGVYKAEIVVEDSAGEYAAWPLTLDLRAGKADEKVPAGTPRP